MCVNRPLNWETQNHFKAFILCHILYIRGTNDTGNKEHFLPSKLVWKWNQKHFSKQYVATFDQLSMLKPSFNTHCSLFWPRTVHIKRKRQFYEHVKWITKVHFVFTCCLWKMESIKSNNEMQRIRFSVFMIKW